MARQNRLQKRSPPAEYLRVEHPRSLPTGVVTFLMTDIEGSTRRWEQEPDAMRQALTRHDAIVTVCVQRQHGDVIKSKGEGDSVFAVFRHVRDAVTAALVLQCTLGLEKWATSTPLRVRMSVHTGPIELRHGDYYGTTVNRCARLRALASGGQVLLSGATAELTRDHLPSGASLTDLGVHQLKDLSAPERVWQLVHPQMQNASATAAPPALAGTAGTTSHVYKLTDHLNYSRDGRLWGQGIRHDTTGGDEILCYTSPAAAALLNAQDERFQMPRLWEASVDQDSTPGDASVACHEVKTLRQVSLPTVNGQQHARFAVLCARAAYGGGLHETEFANWADGWLAGHDNSGVNARAMADMLEEEADRGNGLVNPEEMMAANAARSATHAARLSWLVGRERNDTNAQAILCATQSVQTALRMTLLDLPALAEQAIPAASLALAR
jgi:class 3 adenylate cyclase